MSDSEFGSQLDQLNIETPEQVDLRLPIAGIGSRFLAVLADTLLQFVALIVVWVVIFIFIAAVGTGSGRGSGGSLDTAGKWFIAGIILFFFLLYWGYFSLCEAYWNGQTPGKRLVKIRVIKDSGRQITLFEALARNLLRPIDAFPGNFYLVGLISMLCNRQQKRLGDLAAGTIVVHERASEQPLMGHNSRGITASLYQQPQPVRVRRADAIELPADALARLRAEDLNVVDSFFARAIDFDIDTRARVVARIAGEMARKMNVTLPEGVNPERMLEAIASGMRSHSR